MKNREALFEALADFVENNHEDPKAAIIFTSGIGDPSLSFVYFGPNPPKGAFRKFENISPMTDSTATQSYLDIVRSILFIIHLCMLIRLKIKASDFVMSIISMRTSFRVRMSLCCCMESLVANLK
jgi:hypothetical protein